MPALDVDDALADIQRVADQLGEPPTVTQYRAHGEYSPEGIANHFDGSFVQAREAAGVADGQIRPNSREDLLDDIRRVAEIVDGEPSKDDYHEHGDYSLSGITYRFDSWIDAKKEAGVYSGGIGVHRDITDGELLNDLERVGATIGGYLTREKYDEGGEFNSVTIQRQFGTWEEACTRAGVQPPQYGPKDVSDSDILADIELVGKELGHPPSKKEYNDLGKFTYGIARTRFESWNTAVRKAGFEPNDPGALAGKRNGYWKGGYEPYYGPNWYDQRRAARKRDAYECAACGLSDGDHIQKYGWELEVHHIIPASQFGDYGEMNDLDNLITLCREHHRKYEELPASECEKLKD